MTGEPTPCDPLEFRRLDPRAELAFLKRADLFLDMKFYMGAWPGVKNYFRGERIHFQNTFALPRADKPDQPRLIIDGGTKLKKTDKSVNDCTSEYTRYTHMAPLYKLMWIILYHEYL